MAAERPANATLPCEPPLCPTAATLLFLPVMYALLSLTALPGNALSLWVFLRRIATVSPTHVYLSHLSASNLLLSLTAPFLALYYARGPVWRLHGALCQLVLHGVTPVLHLNVYISLMILTWVALSRFASLIRNTHASRPSACATLLPHTFFSRLARASFAKGVCAVVWVVSLAGVVPVTVYYSVHEAMDGDGGSETDTGTCYSPEVEVGGSVSRTLSVVVMAFFFVLYLLVLLSYLTVLRHIRRSRRSAHISTSHSLLGRVLRNIVVILVVLSVCLLPYHIFKPVFIAMARSPLQPAPPAGLRTCDGCHPLSVPVEVRNCLFLLAALRGSTDPVMYFLLDRTFRHQILRLLGRRTDAPRRTQVFWLNAGGGSSGQQAEECVETNAPSTTVELHH